jgi:uridine kinase
MTHTQVFEQLHSKIIALQSYKKEVLRVAINGIEGSGKTTFCKAFAEFLNSQNIKTIHISIDEFHHPRKIRFRQGRDSAKGYYEDAYNEDFFVDNVLKSSQQNHPTIIAKYHDLETDKILSENPIEISKNTIILTDGAYLFKDIYVDHWDLKIYLKVDFEIAMKRGIERDKESLGGVENATLKYENRYHQASRMYMEEFDPISKADIAIDNNNFEDLIILE